MKFLKQLMLASLLILISKNVHAQDQSEQQHVKTNTTSIEARQLDQNLEYYLHTVGLKALITIVSFMPYYLINECPRQK